MEAIKKHVQTYNDWVNYSLEHELPDWVKAIRYALQTGNISGLAGYLPWVQETYYDLKAAQAENISKSDSR